MRWALPVIAASLCASPVMADPTPSKIADAYAYRDETLGLRIMSPSPVKTTIEWTALDLKGRPTAKHGAKNVTLEAGENAFELSVGPAPAHRLTYTIAKEKRRILANRGSWYAEPSVLEPSSEPRAISEPHHDVSSRDTFLATGFVATARGEDGESHLEIGRTLGPEGMAGIAVSPQEAIAIVARGDVGAVTVILTQAEANNAYTYFEYPLNLRDALRRYVVPIDAFVRRGQGRGRLVRVASISLRSTQPAKKGATIEVDHLAIAAGALRLAEVAREGAQIVCKTPGARPDMHAEVFIAGQEAEPVLAAGPAKSAVVRLPDPKKEAIRAWACFDDGSDEAVCDPPDAPLSSYGVPSIEGGRLVVDAFRGLAPVNAFRAPAVVFTSSVADPTLFGRRSGRSIVLRAPSARPMRYIGHRTELPPRMPKAFNDVEVHFRMAQDRRAIQVGIRDRTGREPKVRIADYLLGAPTKDAWFTARIPIEAFRVALAGFSGKQSRAPLDRIDAITVALEHRDGAEPDLEIDEIAVGTSLVPLVIENFDGEAADETTLGGKVRVVSEGGANLGVRALEKGAVGRGAALDIRGVGGSAYALFSLGLVRVDARPYKNLAFWARGENGGDHAVVHLNDGRTKASVALFKYGIAGSEWNRVEIPLADFGKSINRSALTELSFAWEEENLPEATLELDEIRLE